jgi:peptidyl-prolyl cis-trans isomerase D
MLDMFRKRGVASFVYSGLMAAMAVVFVIQFRPGANSQSSSSLSKKCVAKVRGECIDETDWKAQRYLLRGYGEQAPALNYNKMAVDSLVERALLETEAKRLGLRVSEDDVMQEIVRYKVYVHVPAGVRGQARMMGINDAGFRGVPFGTKEKPFDQQIYEKTLHSMTGQVAAEFEESQQHELLAARVLHLVAERVRVSDSEAWEQYAQDKSTVTARTVRFSPKYFGERFLPLDTASIEKWAGEHKAEVDPKVAGLPKDKPAKLIKARHILITAKKDDPADKRAEAKKKAEDLLAQIKAGGDFAKLAKENSADPGSKDNGGEYDWNDGAQYVPEYQKSINDLKPGEANVTETQFGYHVIQVVGRMDGAVAVAYPMYIAQRGDELAKSAADKVSAALVGKLPVKLDEPAVKAKIDEAKKSGKQEAEATQSVIDEESKQRVEDAITTVLKAMAPPEPKPAEPKPGEAKPADPQKSTVAPVPVPAPTAPPAPGADKKDDKGAASATPPAPPAPGADKKDDKAAAPAVPAVPAGPPAPAWETDERRPHVDESSPVNVAGSPVNGLEDQAPVVQAAFKLTKEAPITLAPVKASSDYFLILLRDRHEATKDEFAKDRTQYVGGMLAKKREDAVVNFLNDLRESVGKDVWMDQKYVADESKKKDGAGDQQPMPYEDEPAQ